MNSQHLRKGFASLFISLTLACALLAPSASLAQQKRSSSSSGKAGAASSSSSQASEKRARRERAIRLLIETANGARGFKEMVYRARIQALAADALWAYDEESARLIFKRAWEAASAADRDEQRAEEEAAGVFSNSDEVTQTAARNEVLSKAAARDLKLADGFLREMVDERERAEDRRENQSNRLTPWRELSPSGKRRLALAYRLLNEGNYSRASQVAEPLINEGVSGDLVEFLLHLLQVMLDPAGGSYPMSSYFGTDLYKRLIDRTAADPRADANDVLLLSSFLVSPDLLMVVDEKGGLQYRSLPHPPFKIAPWANEDRMLKSFRALTVSVLLQRPNVPGQAANALQDRVARYVATGRMLPFFEQAGPEYAQLAPSMRSQMIALSREMEANRRDTLNAQFELTSLNGKNASDPLEPQLQQLNRTSDKQERDRISFGLARRAARERMWDRAQRTAYQIEDGDLRRATLAFIVVSQIADVSRAYRDDKENDYESVARFVRRADAPPFASAWGLAQAALIAARSKDGRDAVDALLTEAQSYAERADRDSRQRVSAYAVITEAAAQAKSSRVWDFMTELVRAANSTPDYMGDETSLATSANALEGSELSEELSIASDSFRLDTIFATMARIDFDKTLTQAQALTGAIPRAYARVASARAELEKK
ncbi:MAG: hypothetical protein ICV60_20140 [Pyrinomonadaceae bacterium]|nr:hypothetical protein [Pyrinomonadaceae bacterium]